MASTTTCPKAGSERCQQFLDYLKPRIDEYHTLLTNNAIFIKRTANIGICSKDLAIAHGCSGPMLRGSLNRDKGDPDVGPAAGWSRIAATRPTNSR